MTLAKIKISDCRVFGHKLNRKRVTTAQSRRSAPASLFQRVPLAAPSEDTVIIDDVSNYLSYLSHPHCHVNNLTTTESGNVAEFLSILETQITDWLPRLVQLHSGDSNLSSLMDFSGNEDDIVTARWSVRLVTPDQIEDPRDFVIIISNGQSEATIDGCFTGLLVKCHVCMPPMPDLLSNPLTAPLDKIPGFKSTDSGKGAGECDIRTLLTTHYNYLASERAILCKVVISLMGLIFGTQDIINSHKVDVSFNGRFPRRLVSKQTVGTTRPIGCKGRSMTTVSSSSSSPTIPLTQNNVSFTGNGEIKAAMKRLAEEMSPQLKTYRNRVIEFSHAYSGGSASFLDTSPLTFQISRSLFLLYTASNMATLTDLGRPLERYYAKNLNSVGMKSLTCEVYMRDASDAALILLTMPRLKQQQQYPHYHHHSQTLKLSVNEYCLDYEHGLVKCIMFEAPEVHSDLPSPPSSNKLSAEEVELMNKLEASFLFLSLSLCVTCQDFKGLIACHKTLLFLGQLTNTTIEGRVSGDTIFLNLQQVKILCHSAALVWRTAMLQVS
jgi:hypothetical protein